MIFPYLKDVPNSPLIEVLANRLQLLESISSTPYSLYIWSVIPLDEVKSGTSQEFLHTEKSVKILFNIYLQKSSRFIYDIIMTYE